MDTPATCTAFQGERRLASGSRLEVALAVKAALERDGHHPILIFDDATGGPIDFDLRGGEAEIEARLAADDRQASLAPRPPGRPKLGVVAREVTLLPRHWEWLAGQPGGASVTLRKLVEAARGAGGDRDRARRARTAADRFMAAMAGDRPGYEEAARALYAGDEARWRQLVEPWPEDIRAHALRLAHPAFEAAGPPDVS
jgi:hypothetical protein